MITVFGRHTSYNVQKVLWLAEELELNYVHKEAGGRFGGNDTAEFLAMNPLGKVPVLQDGANAIWESNTIIRYLAEKFGEGAWVATDAFDRSKSDRWLDWSIDRLEKAFVGVFWGYYRTPPEQRNNAVIADSVVECEQCLALMGRQLDNNEFLIGDHPTVADIATAVFLHRLISIELEIVMPDNIKLWYERLTERIGYQKWVMSDFTELQGRSSY